MEHAQKSAVDRAGHAPEVFTKCVFVVVVFFFCLFAFVGFVVVLFCFSLQNFIFIFIFLGKLFLFSLRLNG